MPHKSFMKPIASYNIDIDRKEVKTLKKFCICLTTVTTESYSHLSKNTAYQYQKLGFR